MEKWQRMTPEEIQEKLNTSVTVGISREEAEERIEDERLSGNKDLSLLYQPKKKNILSCIFAPVTCLPLATSILISLFVFLDGNKYLGAWSLVMLFGMCVCLGIMLWRARKRKEKCDAYSNPAVRIVRLGKVKYTNSANIAPGDILVLSVGDVVPCDARITGADELSVDEFIVNNGKLLRRRAEKSADTIHDENVDFCDAQNILLAGSVIISGECRAVAVAIGEKTQLAKTVRLGEMSGAIKKPVGVTKLLGHIRIGGMIAALALLSLTLVGMVSLRRFDTVSVFMLVLCSVICVSVSMADIWSRIIFSSSIKKLSDGIIIKNNRTIDVLTSFSDLVLLGEAGICDGSEHISSLFLSGRKLDVQTVENKPDRTYRLCECIHTYLKVAEDKHGTPLHIYRDGLESFVREMGFDNVGADLKIRSLYYLDDDEVGGFACAESSSSNYRIAIAFEAYILGECKSLRVGDMSVPLDNTLKHRIIDYIEECENTGETLVFVVTEEVSENAVKGTNVVLEGILAFEKHLINGLDETLECYRQMGITITSLMPDESPETVKYLVSAGIVSSPSDIRIAFASDFREKSRDITYSFGKYSAYVGFDMTEYVSLVNQMKAQGRIVVSYGVEDVFNSVATITDASVGCNTLLCHTSEYRDSYYEKFPECGMQNSHNSSQRGRIVSGLLVRRESGLSDIICAADTSCASYINLSYYLKYFALMICVILGLVFTSVLSGIVMINHIQILFLTVFSSLVGLYAFAHNNPDAAFFRSGKRAYAALPAYILKAELLHFAFRLLAVLLYFAVSLTLVLMGVIGTQGIAYASFFALFVLCVYEIFNIRHEYAQKPDRAGRIVTMVIVSSAFVLTIFIGMLGLYVIDTVFKGEYRGLLAIPTKILSEFYGGHIDVLSLILIPIFLILVVVCELVCNKISHKIQAKINTIK